MKYVPLAVIAALMALVVALALTTFSSDSSSVAPVKPPVAARYWSYAKLAQQFEPLHPVSIAVEVTPNRYQKIAGCKVSATTGMHRVVLLCK